METAKFEEEGRAVLSFLECVLEKEKAKKANDTYVNNRVRAMLRSYMLIYRQPSTGTYRTVLILYK